MPIRELQGISRQRKYEGVAVTFVIFMCIFFTMWNIKEVKREFYSSSGMQSLQKQNERLFDNNRMLMDLITTYYQQSRMQRDSSYSVLLRVDSQTRK